MMKYNIVRKLPKIELHCHLDGSVSPSALKSAAVEDGIPFLSDAKEFINMVQVPASCGSLSRYLKCFDTILPYLQSKRALAIAAYDLMDQAAKENVVYMEVRFSPLSCCQKGLSCEEVVRSVLNGLEKGKMVYGVKSRVLLCLMRGDTEENNRLVIETAHDMISNGVVGVDLAGDESKYPPENYQALIHLAQDYGLKVTMHAGECGSVDNVKTSMLMGAQRIGHGIALQKSAALRKECAKANIILEMCPSSNFQTGAAKSWETYPIETFWNEHIPISINTDNRTVSNTTLTQEYLLLNKKYQFFNYNVMQQLNLEALSHTFLLEEEKNELSNIIQNAYRQFIV